MFKFVVFLAVLAIAASNYLVAGSGLVYSAAAVPVSGYEYTHTVQAPDYVNHVSVSAPLNGLVNHYSSPLIQSLYSSPVAW